jgi:hypothetical protein
MKTWKTIPLVALAGALWLQPAAAAAHGHGGMGACRDDVKKLCGEDQYSRAGIAACLEQHSSELSADCQKRYTKMKARIEEFHQACNADAQKLCPTADKGMKTFRCLRDHETDLSQPCKDEIAEVRERHQEKREKRHNGGAASDETKS